MAYIDIKCTTNDTNFAKSAQVRVNYTSGGGSITITSIQGNRTDGYATHGNSGSGSNKYTVTVGGRAHEFYAHNIAFGGNSWITWDDFSQFTESGFAGSTEIRVYVNVCNQSLIQGREWVSSIDAGKLPAPTNVSINPVPSRTSINLNRTYNNATYCQYNISDLGWIAEGSSYSNGIGCSGNTVAGLTPNTYYTCQVRFGNGNSDLTYSSKVGVTTTANAPSVSSYVSSVSATSAYIEFSATYDYASYSSHSIVYGTTTNYGYNASSQQLTGLTPNTVYYYKVTVTDTAGRLGTHTGSFTTPKPNIPSVTPPTLVNATDSTITVKATATPGTGAVISSISFTLDDTNWYSSGTDTYTFTGLEDGKTYTIRSGATDNYGQMTWGDTSQFSTLVGSFTKVIRNGQSQKGTVYIIKNGTKTKISKNKIKIIR